MEHWEADAVQEQQNRDFKEVWSHLREDIALVCLCGNHDVSNRPTPATMKVFEDAYGDSYLAFWANGTYNIMLNNCLFFDPTGAPGEFCVRETYAFLVIYMFVRAYHGTHANQLFRRSHI